MPKDQLHGWEKSFEEKFKVFEQVAEDEVDGTFAIEADRERVKSFIASLLKTRETELREKVEKLTPHFGSIVDNSKSYPPKVLLSDVLALLNQTPE